MSWVTRAYSSLGFACDPGPIDDEHGGDDGLRRLATDGCEPPNAPVQTVWPAINQASTGFFRWAFGIDAEPIGLDASAVTPGVTVESK